MLEQQIEALDAQQRGDAFAAILRDLSDDTLRRLEERLICGEDILDILEEAFAHECDDTA